MTEENPAGLDLRAILLPCVESMCGVEERVEHTSVLAVSESRVYFNVILVRDPLAKS